MTHTDTIVALATASGLGAIAVIRISGNDALVVADKIFRSVKGTKLADKSSHTLSFGTIVSEDKVYDEVVVSVYRNPNSYTGEDTVEISCHGSTYIQQAIIALIQSKGVRLANPGEFTQRAFLNGKMDLAQAEAVADLIASQNEASQQIALTQMRGGFSSDLKQMREELINFVALIELELDFSEEDLEFANREKLNLLIDDLLQKINPLIDSFKYGNALKSGIPIAIVGKPNAGKSTLLNALLNEERAIVSSIAGTTRDTIEEKLIIDGIEFRFIDTAGIRETTDEIESIGIKKALEKAGESQIILYLFDKNQTSKQEVLKDYTKLKNAHNQLIIIPTKIDLYPNYDWSDYIDYLNTHISSKNIISLSAKDKINLNFLKDQLVSYVKDLKMNIGSHIIVNQRHYQELQYTQQALRVSQQALANGISNDWIAIHLKEALLHLGNITGQIDVDKDILGTIFGKFCVGK